MNEVRRSARLSRNMTPQAPAPILTPVIPQPDDPPAAAASTSTALVAQPPTYQLRENIFRVVTQKNEKLKLRVTLDESMGRRSSMEDRMAVGFVPATANNSSYVYAGVFDGHGGHMAAEYTSQNLFRLIDSNPKFAGNDQQVLEAIKEGFLALHKKMLPERNTWPMKQPGELSTCGTTASIVIIKNGKIYSGHVGDSRIVLGEQDEPGAPWVATDLTVDHKPESERERAAIEARGGKVQLKNGIYRVCYRKTWISKDSDIIHVDVPFLSIARSLGDYWSFNKEKRCYVVSPKPDVDVKVLDPSTHRCLILSSDGLWGMMSSQEAVKVAEETTTKAKRFPFTNEVREHHDPRFGDEYVRYRDIKEDMHVSANLTRAALTKWDERRHPADNISVLTIVFEPMKNTETAKKKREYEWENGMPILQRQIESPLQHPMIMRKRKVLVCTTTPPSTAVPPPPPPSNAVISLSDRKKHEPLKKGRSSSIGSTSGTVGLLETLDMAATSRYLLRSSVGKSSSQSDLRKKGDEDEAVNKRLARKRPTLSPDICHLRARRLRTLSPDITAAAQSPLIQIRPPGRMTRLQLAGKGRKSAA